MQHSLECLVVSMAIEGKELDSVEPAVRNLIQTVPGCQKILPQKLNSIRVVNSDHHVVPRSVVLAEIDSSDICGHVVNDNQLFVIATEEFAWRQTVRIREANRDAGGFQFVNHPLSFPGLVTELLIENICRRVTESIAQNYPRKRVGENSFVLSG